MRFILAALLILVSFDSAVAAKNDPCWMVRIEKRVSPQTTIRGTGYAVQLKDRLFIRTASHVILGDLAGVTIYDCKQQPVAITANGIATNNMLDDALIEARSPNLYPLGVYNPLLDLFLITRPAYADYQMSKRRVSLEPAVKESRVNTEDGFISAHWLKRNDFKFRVQKSNLYPITGTPYEEFKNATRNAQLSEIYLADVSILPGESGSPVVGLTDHSLSDLQVPGYNSPEMFFRVKLDDGLRSGFFDDSGRAIDVARVRVGPIVFRDSIAYIKGHVISSHRKLLIARFLDSDTFPVLNKAYFATPGRDISNTVWKFDRGLTYRVFSAGGLSVSEIDSVAFLKGDGTANDGGDGTANDGGDGTANDGGDGTANDGGDGTANDGGGKASGKKLPPVGMTINGKAIISFRLLNPADLQLGKYTQFKDLFEKNGYLSASWYNFTILNRIQILNKTRVYEEISRESNLEQFINQRLSNLPRRTFNLACTIRREYLRGRRLVIDIRLGSLNSDEKLQVLGSIDSFAALQRVKTRSTGIVDIDLTGIFGNDLSFVGKEYGRDEAFGPFILLRSQGHASVRVQCGDRWTLDNL